MNISHSKQMSRIYRTICPLIFHKERASFTKSKKLSPGVIVRVNLYKDYYDIAEIIEGPYEGWVSGTYFKGAIHNHFVEITPLEYLAMQAQTDE